MRDRLPDHWVEMLGPEAEQVNESERVDRRPKFQLAKYLATVDHFPPKPCIAGLLQQDCTPVRRL
jgi:hypothetical protein